MMKEMRQHDPKFENLDDRILITFLFARRHDVKASIELLDRHITIRDRLGFNHHMPVKEECKELMGAGFRKNRTSDKYGRMIYYYFIEFNFPTKCIDDYWRFFFWDCYNTINNESVSTLRNGSVVILDMKNFGWRNIDLSKQGREINQSMSSNFPKRVRAIYVINYGLLFQAALFAARLIIPKKILKRVHIITLEELKDLISEEYLHPKYGGKLVLDDE